MIQRRKPLRRSLKPFRRKVGVRRVSQKRKREAVIYARKRKSFLEAHRFCEVWIERCAESAVEEYGNPVYPPRSTEVHHKAGRTGKNYLDESTWMAVSAEGHRFIHEHPSEARRLGFIV